MKRWAWAVAISCIVLFAGAVWRHVSTQETPGGRITAKQAEQRYYECRPRHWRYLMFKR